ncbi:MAG: hypothetical protein ABFD25_06400 [Clostridiaceae bacterium]
MSETVKKPNQTPESYSPKKPTILSMAEESPNSYRSITEVKAFSKQFEIYKMPASRVIGKAFIHHPGQNAVPFVEESLASSEWPIILNLPRVISDADCGWTCEYLPETDSFTYIVSVLTPAQTPVPDGCQYRDVPETLVAFGLRGENMDLVRAKMEDWGYTTNHESPGCCWNAEFYFEEECKMYPGENNEHWIMPCKIRR